MFWVPFTFVVDIFVLFSVSNFYAVLTSKLIPNQLEVKAELYIIPFSDERCTSGDKYIKRYPCHIVLH